MRAAVLTYTLSCNSRRSSSNTLPRRRSSPSFLLLALRLSSHHQQTLHKHFTFLGSRGLLFFFFPLSPSPPVAIGSPFAPFCLPRVIVLVEPLCASGGAGGGAGNSIQSCNATCLPTGRVPEPNTCSLRRRHTGVVSTSTSSNAADELILTLFSNFVSASTVFTLLPG